MLTAAAIAQRGRGAGQAEIAMHQRPSARLASGRPAKRISASPADCLRRRGGDFATMQHMAESQAQQTKQT